MPWARAPFLIYKVFISPVFHLLAGYGLGCRYEPTCSKYMADAVTLYGLRRGVLKGLARLMRCHPFSSAPFHDPVVRKQSSTLQFGHSGK